MGIGMRNSNFPGSQQWKSRSAKIIARSLLAVSLGGISGCVTLDQLIKDFDEKSYSDLMQLKSQKNKE